MPRLNRSLRACLIALALGATAAVQGCGPFSSESDVDQVKEVVDRVFTSNDPAICFDLVTSRFLTDTYDKDLTKATADCETSQRQGGGTADRIEVQAVTVDGKEAIVVVQVFGGSLDRRTAEAKLVDDEGWKMDVLRLSAPLPTSKETRKAVDETIRQILIGQEVSKKKADCYIKYLREHASDAQLAEDLKMLQGGSVPPTFAAAAKACNVGTSG